MWCRVGAERAKRTLLTAEMGLVYDAVPESELADAVRDLAERMAGIPTS